MSEQVVNSIAELIATYQTATDEQVNAIYPKLGAFAPMSYHGNNKQDDGGAV